MIVMPMAAAWMLTAFTDQPSVQGVAHVLLALGGLEGVRQLRERTADHPWLQKALLPCLLLLLTAALLWPVPSGQMPRSKDHTVHLLRAWHFVTQELAHGHLSGWSDFWFAGWPAGEDYPPGGDFWVALFYLGTFGLLGWKGSYALAFSAVWVVAILGMFRLGRVLLGTTAGTIAALLLLFEKGGFRAGGWSFTVDFGVWPMFLSTGFLLLGLSLLEQSVRRDRARYLVGAGLCVGYALLCHPFSLLILLVALPIYAVVRSLDGAQPASRVCARTLFVGAMGIALSAFWLVPYVAKSEWMGKWSQVWLSPEWVAQKIWDGELFKDMSNLWLWLAILGGARGIYRRHWAASFVALLGAACLYIASTAFLVDLDLGRFSRTFSQIQYQRFAVPVKLCAMLLSGYALQGLFSRRRSDRKFTWRGYALTALTLLAVAPFLGPVAAAYQESYMAPGRPDVETSLDGPHYQAFLQWSREEQEGSDAFYRIAYATKYNDHRFADAPVYNHTPALKQGFTPATTFKARYEEGGDPLYRLLSVKYVVSTHPQHSPELRLDRRFGPIRVYRFEGYTPQRYTVVGAGTVDVQAWDEERIRLRVRGADAGSKLVLHVSNYANWRAEANGEPVQTATTELEGFDGFLQVPLRNGELEVYYAWPWSNRLGALLSLLALCVPLVLAVARLRPAWMSTWRAPLQNVLRKVEARGTLIFGGIVLLAGAFATAKAVLHHDTGLEDRIEGAHVEMVGPGGGPCPWREDRFVCSRQRTWNHVAREYVQAGGGIQRCIWAHPVPDQTLKVVFDDVRLGRSLAGYHGLDKAAERLSEDERVTLAIDIGETEVGRFELPPDERWERWHLETPSFAGETHDVTFRVRATSPGAWHYCFTARAEQP